jgi:hypothetical protein
MSKEAALSFLRQHTEPGPDILGNVSDRVSNASLATQPASASLALVEPTSLEWHITTGFQGGRQTRARFTLSGRSYDLSVTDPEWEERLGALPMGVHPRAAGGIPANADVFLTISLGEPFHGDCFKLVAAVIVL